MPIGVAGYSAQGTKQRCTTTPGANVASMISVTLSCEACSLQAARCFGYNGWVVHGNREKQKHAPRGTMKF